MDINFQHIHNSFRRIHANDDISFSVKSGRNISMLSKNGAGKSTLMKILSGFQPYDSGEIWIDGKQVDYHDPLEAIRHGIGMLQQDPLDIPAFTVIENFIYGSGTGISLPRRTALKQLKTISQRFGFELEADIPIAQLSIGQRQQLEIVRLLTLGVKTLILDEPTTGISAEQKQILFDALRELAANDGLTVLLVSHKLEDVIALCHEVAVLRAGRMVGEKQMPATTQELVTMMFGQALAPQTRQPLDLKDANTALEIEGAHLHGKRLNVEDFSLKVRSSEVIGLAGLDGSGQEMLLRACAGLWRLQQGRIRLGSRDMTGKSIVTF